MKRIIIILLILIPSLLNAGVIMTKSGDRIEDVTIKSVTSTEIVFVSLNGQETTILKSDISAILYDDGRYEEIKQSSGAPLISISDEDDEEDDKDESDGSSAPQIDFDAKITEFNVYAFGKNAKLFYITDHEYDGTKVEYRVVYKDQKEEPEWQYLGLAPFAYTTAKGGINPLINKDAKEFSEVRPLVIENFKQVKKVEFRLSKEGYETTVVSPLFQADFTGLYYMISLNKLIPVNGNKKEKETKVSKESKPKKQIENDEPAVKSEPESAVVVIKESPKKQEKKAAVQEEDTRMIPQACLTEGKKAYDAALENARERALRQGYSKDQAKTIAPEFAAKAKDQAIDACYNRIVVQGEDYDSNSPQEYTFSQGPISLELSDELKKIVPQACLLEGKKAYDKAYAEALDKALRQGYSKSQANEIAKDAAPKAQQATIDEFYNRIVLQGEEYIVEETQKADKKSNPEKEKEVKKKDKPAKEVKEKEAKDNSKEKKNKPKAKSPAKDEPPIVPIVDSNMIIKINKNEYKLGETQMDRKAYEQFIHDNCPEAWKKHLSAQRTIISGWTFFGTGIVLTSMWGLMGVKGEYVPEYYSYYTRSWGGGYYRDNISAEVSAIVLGSLGAAFTVLSIPLLGAGYGIKHNTYKTYNKSCASSSVTPIAFNLTAGSNGLGITMNF